MTPALLLPLVVIAALCAFLYVVVKRQTKKANEAWAAVAARHGGMFNPKAGPWHNRTRLIKAVVDGISLRVDHYVVSTGKSATTYTRFRAPAAGSGKLELRVYAKHALSGISRALGFQDVPTGDAAFDDDFVVKANDEDLARAWLTEDVRAAIRSAEGYQFAIKDGELTVTKAIVEADVEALDTAARATALVAGRGERIREGWQRFASERDGAVTREADGRLRIEVEQASVPLRIETEGIGDGEHTFTRVESRVVGGKGRAYEISNEAELEALSAEVRDRLAHLAPLRVESDGEHVRVLLRGVETDERRLREACELASELADLQSETYR